MLIEKNTFQNLHKMVKTYEKNPTGDASLFQYESRQNSSIRLCSVYRENNNGKNAVQEAKMQQILLRKDVNHEMGSLKTKTPVSILEELLRRHGTAPKFELLEKKGSNHQPIYQYRVYAENNKNSVATGIGSSKKFAKQAAAKNLLDILTEKQTQEQTKSPVAKTNDHEIIGNPIGRLQELCSCQKWTLPFYEMQCNESLFDEIKHYTIVCRLLDFKEVGSAVSKKLAKQISAFKMWKNVQDMLLKDDSLPKDLDDLEDLEMINNPIGQLHELCNSRNWAPPSYVSQPERDLSVQDNHFTIICQVLDFKKVGAGKSKKMAKRVAAGKMWQHLQSVPFEDNSPESFDDDKNLNPIGRLQDLCISQNWALPSYEMQHENSLPGQPDRFTMVCQVLNFKEVGTATSKKKAKRLAAIKMWQNVQSIQLKDNNLQKKFDDVEEHSNPVGRLQELCISRKWALPSYEIHYKGGLFGNDIQFTTVCKVSNFIEVCSARSKKLSKRMAATKMWNNIQQMPVKDK